MASLGRRQEAEGFDEQGHLVFILQDVPSEQRFGGRFARRKAGTDTLEQERLHEPRSSGTVLEGRSKVFRYLIRQIKGQVREQTQSRKAHASVDVGGSLRIRMDVNGDLFQQASLFECPAVAQDGVADDRVVFSVIAWFQCLQESLLLKEPKRTETPVGEEDVVRNTELQPQVCEGRFFITRW